MDSPVAANRRCTRSSNNLTSTAANYAHRRPSSPPSLMRLAARDRCLTTYCRIDLGEIKARLRRAGSLRAAPARRPRQARERSGLTLSLRAGRFAGPDLTAHDVEVDPRRRRLLRWRHPVGRLRTRGCLRWLLAHLGVLSFRAARAAARSACSIFLFPSRFPMSSGSTCSRGRSRRDPAARVTGSITCLLGG